MIISHKLTYKFTVTARELKLIRRSLEKEGGQGSELARQLTAQLKNSLADLKQHWETIVEVESKTDLEGNHD